MTKPPANILELPLQVRAEMALPINIWRDGEVVDVPPDELREKATLLEMEPW
jgi:hypothetical protein